MRIEDIHIAGSVTSIPLHEAWLHIPLWFPITRDGKTYLSRLGFYNRRKYEPFASADFVQWLKRNDPVFDSGKAIKGVFCLGSSPNYWHMLMDHVPRLSFYQTGPDKPAPILAAGGFEETGGLAILQEVFRRLALPRVPIVAPRSTFVPVRKVLFPVRPTRFQAVAFWERVLESEPAPEARRRLFVRRGAVQRRRLLNEDAVAERLARHGFEAIDPGTLSFADQIKTFAAADIVVGVHGAAMTNLLFAPRGIRVIELAAGPEQPFFSGLAGEKHQHYRRIAGIAVDDSSMHTDFTIDPATVEQAIGATR
ncbi:MAG: DUF563 domain-containing protein [Alphaproteobacteria bacterium]|nr:DUF563 domain-containing protein [Alphaproteobacteria bacterium]